MRSFILGIALVAGCGVDDVSLGTSSSELSADTTIRVTAYHGGSEIPFAGTEVQFIAPDQTVQTVVTDANGFAEAVSPPNTRVVVFQDGLGVGSHLVRIFDAANPGDHIIAGRRTPAEFPELGAIHFEMSPRTGWGIKKEEVIYYRINVSCSPDNGTVSFQASRDMRITNCPHATNATAVAWVEDGLGAPLTGASVLRNIDLTAHVGGTIRMPAYSPTVTTATAQFVNTPPGELRSWATQSYFGDDPTLFVYNDTFAPQPDVLNTRPSLGVGDLTLSSVTFTEPPFTMANVHHFRLDAGFASNYFVDADASRRMRHVSSLDFSAFSQSVSWSAAPDGQPASMVFIALLVFRTAPQFEMFEIQLYAPGDTTSVTLPTLPAALTPGDFDGVHKRGFFYRVSNETYSEWLQVHSSRDPTQVHTWSSELPRELWFSFTP